jgi:hypothetical protein
MEFTIGADPEVFVGREGKVRSIIGLIGGTKENPQPLPIGDGFGVQEDNVAMEFNIPVSHTKATFVSNISLADMHGLQFVKDSAVSFPAEELTHPMALVFGCDPDFNAWTKSRNPRPYSPDRNLRSCGGHVHIGVDAPDETKLKIIRACDLHLGVSSVLLDTGDLRKQLYGKAGAFRLKSYGVEYRTLSNFWIFDEKLTGWVYDNTKAALDAVQNGLPFEEDGDLIQQAINDNDKGLAEMLVARYNVGLVQ